MLPFLKKNQGGGPIESTEKTRTPDDNSTQILTEAIAEELLQAFEKKDFKAIREALSAFCHHIRSQDEVQDAAE